MATPRPTSVDVSVIAEPTPVQPRANDVLFVAGKLPSSSPGAQSAGTVGGPYYDQASVQAAVGSGDVVDFTQGIFDNASIPVYLSLIAADGDQDDMNAAIRKVNVPVLAPTLLAAPTGAAAGTPGPTKATLQAVCQLNDIHATCAMPYASVAAAVTAARASSHNRVMNVFGGVNGTGDPLTNFKQAEGWYMGAAIARARELGLQAGLEHAPVHGIHNSNHNLSHSPRSSITTDVSQLVAAYIGTIVQHRQAWEIQGSYMAGWSDGRSQWPVARVIDHLEHVLEESGIGWLGRTDTRRLVTVALGLERAGQQLVANGELFSLTIEPHPTANTAATRATGRAIFLAHVGVRTPLAHIEIELVLEF